MSVLKDLVSCNLNLEARMERECRYKCSSFESTSVHCWPDEFK